MVNAFNSREGCDIPEIPKIEDDLIEECYVPSAPPSIFQGLDFPPIPLPPSPGCAELRVGEPEITRLDTEPLTFEVEVENLNDDNCYPQLNFGLNVPCDCAEMKIGEVEVEGCELDIRFRKRPPQEYGEDEDCFCDYYLDFDIEIDNPCEKLEWGKVNGKIVLTDHYSLAGRLKKSNNDDCAISADLELHLRDIDVDPCVLIQGGGIDGEVTVEGSVSNFEQTGGSEDGAVLVAAGVAASIEDGQIYVQAAWPDEEYTITVTTGGLPTEAELEITTASGTDDQTGVTPAPFGEFTNIGTEGVRVAFAPGESGEFIAGQTWSVISPENVDSPDAGVTGEIKKDPDDECLLLGDLDIVIPNPCESLAGGNISGEFVTSNPDGKDISGRITKSSRSGGDCGFEAELDIALPDTCSDAVLINQHAEPIPIEGAIAVTGTTTIEGVEYLLGTKPTKDNMLNVVVALAEIEPGDSGPVAYDSSSGCSETPKVLVLDEVLEADSMGTVADEWAMKKGNRGFLSLTAGDTAVPFKQGDKEGDHAFLINLDEDGAEECPAGGTLAVIGGVTIGTTEFLVGTKPDEDNMYNTAVAIKAIPPGEAGPVAFNSDKRYGEIIPAALYTGVPEDGGPMGTVADSWELKQGNWGFTYLGEGPTSGALFKSGGYQGVLFGTVSSPPLSGAATITIYKVNDDGTKTATGISLPGVIPEE